MKVIKYQREDSSEVQTSPRLHTDKRAEYLVNMANTYFKKAEHWLEEPNQLKETSSQKEKGGGKAQNLLDKGP
jgi:hypothetical protein